MTLNPHTLIAQKVSDEVAFDVSKVKESSFFKSDLSDPTQILDAHLLKNTNLSRSSIHRSVGFYIKVCFESDGL